MRRRNMMVEHLRYDGEGKYSFTGKGRYEGGRQDYEDASVARSLARQLASPCIDDRQKTTVEINGNQ